MRVLAAVSERWREQDRLVRAILLSLIVHLLLYGVWSFGHRHQLWQRTLLPRWLFPAKNTVEAVREALQQAQNREKREVPLVFVEVSPRQATPDAPEETPFYSANNSRAANPTRDTESNQPKIDGQQTEVFRTEDVERPQPQPLQPSLPKPVPAEPVEPQTVQEKAEPRPQQPKGDLEIARPSTNPRDTRGDAEKPQEEKQPRERVRTLADARAKSGLPGERVRQTGGVPRMEDISSVDAKATPFGEYDRALIYAVTTHWYSLVDQTRSYHARSGKVVVEFRLLPDGRAVNIKVREESVGELLATYCWSAIDRAAPFGRWPDDMRRLIGDHRDIRFTFFYN
jgi:hypothetical protein